MASVINGSFVAIRVLKREDNKYNKNNFYIPLGINILSLLCLLFSLFVWVRMPLVSFASLADRKNKNTNVYEWVMNNSINGLFVTIHVKKKGRQ